MRATEENADTRMRNARIAGALILTATATYMLGSGLVGSIPDSPDFLAEVYANGRKMTVGVLLQFACAAAVVGVGAALLPVLRKHGEVTALGYAATRVIECVCLLAGGLVTLSLVALGREAMESGTGEAAYSLALGAVLAEGSNTAYLIAMAALGLGSLPFCYLLYRARLIPRPMAILGLTGYAALLAGSLLEVFGYDLAMIHYAPGGLFELIFPIWLIFKGFDSSATASGAVPVKATGDRTPVGSVK